MKSYDSVVIGGGPAGMTAALYLLRSGANIAVIEKLSTGGQMLMTEVLDNYPGFPKGIKGYELADLQDAHVADFQFDRYNDQVASIEHGPSGVRVRVGETWIETKTLVIASGAAYKKLGAPGEKEFLGKGVSYCALCDGNFYRNQTVAVVGGGNSALEESLYLTKLVAKLHLIHRRDEFRGAKVYQDKVASHPKIEIHYDTVVEEILGENGVSSLALKNVKTGETSKLDVDGVFVFIGFEPQAGFYPEGLETDKWGFILTDTEMRTNLPGVFAAGDIRSKLCRQVCTAVGDGATAANSAYLYLEEHHG